MSKSNSKYDAILTRMEKLNKGGTTKVSIPVGVNKAVFMNRLNAAIVRRGIEAPRGYRYAKRTVYNNRRKGWDLTISLMREAK